MTKQHTLTGFCILVLCSLILTACGGQGTPATATVDPNLIVTEAFQTVQAGQALTQAAAPTATQTATVEPTATMDPTMAAGMTATSQAVMNPLLPTNTTVVLTPGAGTTPGVGTTPGATTPQVVPTATSGGAAPPPAATSGDKCEWVSNSPADNSVLKRNASYDATIVVKNSGTTTWNSTYALRYFGGERMGIPSDYFVQREVKAGENYSFIFTLTMPDSTGKKEALMVVQNGQGSTMCWINLPVEVVD